MNAGADADLIYHVCRREEWDDAARAGVYLGSTQDRDDGFIHFSAPNQLEESVAKHRAGQNGLVLLSVDPARLDSGSIRWEPSRGGTLFPHVYGSLRVDAVVRVDDLPLGPDGVHCFPSFVATGG